MTFAQMIKADAVNLLADVGETVEIILDSEVVDTTTGPFMENVQTVSPSNAEQFVLRPMVTIPEAKAAGITKAHTFRINGVVYRLYGTPKPAGRLGWVSFMLVK